MLICSNCKIEKSHSEFFRNCSAVRGYSHYCKPCVKIRELRSGAYRNATRYAWAKNNPIKQRYLNFKHNLRVRFGVSEDLYLDMWVAQEGLCKICNKGESSKEGNTGKIKNLSVDHCHKTGKIRGLLCHKCNLGIGHLNDDIDNLKRAIKYLEIRK